MSETNHRVHIHELVLDSEPKLQQLVDLPSPEPPAEEKDCFLVTATWAPDGHAVLLRYGIRDELDARGQFDDEHYFEVGHTRTFF